MKHKLKHKLKYIELFENYTNDGVKIPYSKISYYGELNIEFPKSATSVPPVFNDLTTEVNGHIQIENTQLTQVTGFNNLKYVGGHLSIIGNPELTQVTGFDSLDEINMDLFIENNPNLVTLSIPSTIIKSVDYNVQTIEFESIHEFKYPDVFINSDVVIQDCIDKFNPGLHGEVVVTQIIENIETWGTPETQGVIINHLLSKGNYLDNIPEGMKHLIEDTYKHLYHSDFDNTGAKSVAKVATGVTYGLF